MFNPVQVIKKVPVWFWVVGAVGVALYVSKKGVSGAAADVTSGVIKGAGDVATGAAVGVVKGVGSIFGVSDTDLNECKACIQRGDNYGASKYCTLEQFSTWQALSIRKRIFGTPFSMSDIFN